jgi:hypothetical protein
LSSDPTPFLNDMILIIYLVHYYIFVNVGTNL